MRLFVALLALGAALGLAACGGADDPREAGDCSAAGLELPLPADPKLTEAAEETRQAIARAAVECDYERLEELALGHERRFTYGYGDVEDRFSPGEYWRHLEEGGHPFLALLVRTLSAPALDSREIETDAVSDEVTFHWPPEGDREAMAAIYGEAVVTCWEEFGSSYPYRTTIFETGEWWFTVTTETDTGPREEAPNPPADCLGLPD